MACDGHRSAWTIRAHTCACGARRNGKQMLKCELKAQRSAVWCGVAMRAGVNGVALSVTLHDDLPLTRGGQGGW